MDVFTAALAVARQLFVDAAVAAAWELGVFAGRSDIAVHPRKLRALLDVLRAAHILPLTGPPPPKPDLPRTGWGLLADVLRTGEPLPIPDEAAYHAHLLTAGADDANHFARAAIARGHRTLVDAGGGAGAYSAAFLDAHPDTTVTLVDAPAVVGLARDHLARFGDRVRFVEARIEDADVPPHDVALLANVLHLHDPDTCARLVERVAGWVRPGGDVVVKDLIHGTDEGTFFALNMALYTRGGDVYSDADIARWLESAFAVDVQHDRGFHSGTKADPPHAFVDVLRRALATTDDDTALRRHYFTFMPRQRAEQLARPLFQRELDHAKLPRLSRARARLADLLTRAGVPIPDALAPAPTLRALYERTYFAGLMPLLYGTPAELAFIEGLLDDGHDFHDVVDRWLAAPFVHELSHLDRRRPALNPYLDECFSGYLGVVALPELAYPAPGESNALYAAPWFAQVGQLIARTFGLERAVRAHAGLEPWPRAFLDETEDLYWREYAARPTLHFLSDAFTPQRWLDLIRRHGPAPADPAFDLLMVEDGLRALSLRNFRAAGTFRVESAPPVGSVTVDRERLLLSAPRRLDALDDATPSYPLPDTLRAQGRLEVELPTVDQIPALARRILATIE